MADINPDLRPVLEMFANQVKHAEVHRALSDWRNTLQRGALPFGRREALSDDLDFNTLVYTTLNPAPGKGGRRIVLEPKLDIAGVISSRKQTHAKFQYLKNEIVIMRATGRWDYEKNAGPLDISIAANVTVRLPPEQQSKSASEQLVREVGQCCFSWLVVNRPARPK